MTALRRGLIRRLIGERRITSQQELLDLLAAAGHRVTQTTVSRDLAALGARKEEGPDGAAYVLGDRPGDTELAAVLGRYAEEVAWSGPIVVVKTPPGAAHLVAAAIDRTHLDGVVGTIAGDDTLMVVADETTGGAALAARLEAVGGFR